MLDLMKILNHKSLAVIRWCGQDALDFKHWDMVKHCHHVSPLVQVRKWIGMSCCRRCDWIRPENLDMAMNPTPRCEKIYAYVPESFPEYHGSDIIKQLNTRFEIITGSGTISRENWYGGECDRFYDGSFIGLMLSPFAGGGQSVLDMGLRGRKCVTNVMDMPNAIPWSSVDDIRKAIEQESLTIGETDTEMSQRVFDAIDMDYQWLDTDYYDLQYLK